MKGHMQDGKFHPHTQTKGVRKSRDPNEKTKGVRLVRDVPITITTADRQREEEQLSRIFETFVPVVGQGFNINFAYPQNKHIKSSQIQEALDLGYRIESIEAVINKSGMSNHLHIWLHKIQDWEKT